MNTPIVKINNLRKEIDSQSVIDNINASIGHGDVIALLGENGSGKTTLMELLLGFSFPSDGSIELFNNEAATELSNSTKQNIGYVPQQNELFEYMTVESYLNSIAAFYKQWNQTLIESLITLWKIPASKVISKLSVGQKQMVSILAAIGHEPSLLILDEPVSSLDPSSRRKFLQALIEMQLERDVTILFSTHIVSDVERIANRLWVLKSGRLVLDESIDKLKEDADLSLEDLFLELNNDS